MNNSRRDFFKSAAVLGALGVAGLPLAGTAQSAPASATPPAPGDDRRYWVSVVDRIGRPVLENLSKRTLKANMPIEAHPGQTDRATCTHLEAFGRLLCGLAPWLALPGLTGEELKLQQEFQNLARLALAAATDPASPDFLNFAHGTQPLVDTAFLAQALLRAPSALWTPLADPVKKQVIEALKSSRHIPTPTNNNWVMFAATVEAALLELGEPSRADRFEDCVRKMLGWYCGDGAYGDGQFFHFDYYNSFVIQPLLIDALTVLQKHGPGYEAAMKLELRRAKRYAVIQERLIAPDGTFPSLGRSTTYRFGAFQTLALVTLRHELPESIQPAQVRAGLTAIIRKLTEAPGTFDANGWLQIGFCGHQPGLGEEYISTGSLYLCSAGLLPLGLPPEDEFWSAPPAPWTSQKLWSGVDLPADHALADTKTVEVPPLLRKAA